MAWLIAGYLIAVGMVILGAYLSYKEYKTKYQAYQTLKKVDEKARQWAESASRWWNRCQ